MSVHRQQRSSRALAFLVLLVCGLARAESKPLPGLTLEWFAPEGCPSSEQAELEIARLLGQEHSLEPMAIKAQVTATGESRWSMVLETRIRDWRGERTLEAETCQKLTEAAALVVALAVTREVEAPAKPLPPPPSKPLALAFFVRAMLATDVNTLVEPAWSPALALGLWLDDFRIELAGGRSFSQRVQRGPTATIGLELQEEVAFALRGCWEPLVGRFRVGACAGGEVGSLQATSFGVTAPRSAREIWWSLLLGGTASVLLSQRFLVRLEADFSANPRRPGFFVSGYADGEPLHRTAEVGARMTLGLEARFP
ncbi:MAG: hypothetical protein QM765_30420 [Myxococcales bacterium]